MESKRKDRHSRYETYSAYKKRLEQQKVGYMTYSAYKKRLERKKKKKNLKYKKRLGRERVERTKYRGKGIFPVGYVQNVRYCGNGVCVDERKRRIPLNADHIRRDAECSRCGTQKVLTITCQTCMKEFCALCASRC